MRVGLYKYTNAYTYNHTYTLIYRHNTWTTYIYPSIIIFICPEKLEHITIEKCKGERNVSVAS